MKKRFKKIAQYGSYLLKILTKQIACSPYKTYRILNSV